MSRDMKFDEQQVWDWNTEHQPQRLTVEEEVLKDKEEIQFAPSLPTQIDSLIGP